MRFPDPGQQAAQRAAQQAAQNAQRQMQLQQQLNMQRWQRSGRPGPKGRGGCCSGVVAFLVFLVVAAVLVYVVLQFASSPP